MQKYRRWTTRNEVEKIKFSTKNKTKATAWIWVAKENIEQPRKNHRTEIEHKQLHI